MPSGWGLHGVLFILSRPPAWGFLASPLGEEDLLFLLAGKTDVLAYPNGHSIPRLTLVGSLPSPIFQYSFWSFDEAMPFLRVPIPLQSAKLSSFPYDQPDLPPPSYASHNFPPPLESVTDPPSESSGLSESDTNSAASPSPQSQTMMLTLKVRSLAQLISLPILVGDQAKQNA